MAEGGTGTRRRSAAATARKARGRIRKAEDAPTGDLAVPAADTVPPGFAEAGTGALTGTPYPAGARIRDGRLAELGLVPFAEQETELVSAICGQAQLEDPRFVAWAAYLGEGPGHMHRKIWEWCYICAALQERGMLRPGRRGLGFAVGTEALASVFAARGVSVTASDLYTEAAQELGWHDNNEHATGLEALNTRGLCPPDVLRRFCSFRHVDMNAVPDDLVDYDFCWSACSLEHLGSLEHGADFVLRSLDCLRPGGVAVHTTEFNCSSDEETIETGGTVIYRRRDIAEIVERVRAAGHHTEIDYTMGTLPADRFVDVAPYTQNPHLRLELAGYVTTSIGLIVTRRT